MKIKNIVFSIGVLCLGVAETVFSSAIHQADPLSDIKSSVVNFGRLSDCTNNPNEELTAIISDNDDFHYKSLYTDLANSNGQNPVRRAEINYTGGDDSGLNSLTPTEQKLLLTYFECIAGLPAMSLDRRTSEPKPNCGGELIHFMKPVEGGLSYIDNTLFAGGEFNSLYAFDNLLSTAAQEQLSKSAEDDAVLDGRTAAQTQNSEGAFASLLVHVLLSAHRPYNLLFPLMLEKHGKMREAGVNKACMITEDDLRDTINKIYAPITKENAARCANSAINNALIYEVLIRQPRMDAELGDVERRAWITNKTLIRLHDLRDQIGAARTGEIVGIGKHFLESIYSGLVDACQNNDGKVLFAAPDFSERLIKSLGKHWAFSLDAVRLCLVRTLYGVVEKLSLAKNWVLNGWRKVSDAVSSVVQIVKAKFTAEDVTAKKQL